MVTLILGPADLARTRFSFSPLWECVAAFRVWQSHKAIGKHQRWNGLFDGVAAQEEWRYLRAVSLAPSGAIPDFLAPPPPGPFARFSEEVEGLRSTPKSVVLAELKDAFSGSLPPELRVAERNFTGFVDGLCRELDLFWQFAVTPVWPRLRECLEAELVYRSRILAIGGAAAVLRDLHPAVRFTPESDGGVLRIRTRETTTRRANGAGLLLVPSMFAFPEVYVVARRPWRPTLAYAARGVAELWGIPSFPKAQHQCDLGVLIGAGRAAVFRQLYRPRTTSDLAASLLLSQAVISQHLTRLRGAGVLNRARVGRSVFYSLNDHGHEILRIVSGVTVAAVP